MVKVEEKTCSVRNEIVLVDKAEYDYYLIKQFRMDSNFSLKMTLNNHTSGVVSLVVLQNGDLASGSADKTIKIWNLKNGS
ncbi:hypothetical protein BpHYR1_005300, partial [Brachionus plicatilis]